jgi:hypothetical protein
MPDQDLKVFELELLISTEDPSKFHIYFHTSQFILRELLHIFIYIYFTLFRSQNDLLKEEKVWLNSKVLFPSLKVI